MRTLIDGYNLLHAAGILGRRIGPRTLERARHALLNFLAAALDAAERQSTTVVFDAKSAPSGLSSEVDHKGLKVRYAVGFPDADALLEELIRAHSSPRQLVVVSSDHRVQSAAKRRRATAIDSHDWHAALLDRHPERAPGESPDHKPVPPNTEAEVDYWLTTFGHLADSIDATQPSPSPSPNSERSQSAADRVQLDSAHPFPPGYAEDLLDLED